jgi:signal transduction histidine kinase
VGVTVIRIVREALTNVYRHGEGAAVADVQEAAGRIYVRDRIEPDAVVGKGRTK